MTSEDIGRKNRTVANEQIHIWAGGTREAITIRRAPGASRVEVLPEIPVPDQTSGLYAGNASPASLSRNSPKSDPNRILFFIQFWD